MRIAIDVRWIRAREMDGISRYVTNLVTHLMELGANHEYFLIINPAFPTERGRREEGRTLPFSPSPALHFMEAPSPLLSLRDFYSLPAFLTRLGIHLFHAPNYLTSPWTGSYTKVVTVHDLIPFLYPKTLWRSGWKWKLYYKSKYPTYLVLHKADHLIADSARTKRDIMDLFGISPEKITVVWPGIEARFHAGEKPSGGFLKKYGLEGDFLLYLGRQDPYKGLGLLIEAYRALDPVLRKRYRLVIAGKKDARYLNLLLDLIDRLSLKDRVHFLGYVPDEDLVPLYKAASLFIYPSLYEGFGFPPLEAMASGTPVIYSRGSSLEEVIGENGLAFTPNSVPELAQAIRTLLQDSRYRATVSERGRQYTTTLTWQKTAKAILGVYETAGEDL